jgi:large subunit ribosomal protein L5
MATLKDKYHKEIIPAMMEMFSYGNSMEVPHLKKVVVSCGVKDATTDPKATKVAADELTLITGQKAATTKAKKSIANFKLKQGTPIGAVVTLRGDRMYQFLDKFINIGLPKIRDFKGISPNSFDGRGAYSMGLREQLIFPEIDYDKVDKVRGMNVTIVTSAKTDKEARELLSLMGMPFRA